jgi:hypothetical protein
MALSKEFCCKKKIEMVMGLSVTLMVVISKGIFCMGPSMVMARLCLLMGAVIVEVGSIML